MPTGQVTTFHQSGGISFSDVIPDRVHAKVGTAETGEANKVFIINNPNMAKDIFGKGVLVDSINQYFEEFNLDKGQTPVPILAIRPKNDVVGNVEVPTKIGAGTAHDPIIDGTPTGESIVIIKITKSGACGTAEFKKPLMVDLLFPVQL